MPFSFQQSLFSFNFSPDLHPPPESLSSPSSMTSPTPPPPEMLLHGVHYFAELQVLFFLANISGYSSLPLLSTNFLKSLLQKSQGPEVHIALEVKLCHSVLSLNWGFFNNDLPDHLTIYYTLETTKSYGANVPASYPQWRLTRKTVIIF